MGKLSSHWYIQTWDWNLLKETKPRLHSPCTGSEVSASKLQKSGRSPIEVEVSYIPWFTRVFCLFRCWLITKFPINREFLLVLLIIVKLATKINPATTTAHLTLRGAVPGPTGLCHPTSHQIWKKENSKFQSKSSFGASMFKISKVNVYMYIYIYECIMYLSFRFYLFVTFACSIFRCHSEHPDLDMWWMWRAHVAGPSSAGIWGRVIFPKPNQLTQSLPLSQEKKLASCDPPFFCVFPFGIHHHFHTTASFSEVSLGP